DQGERGPRVLDARDVVRDIGPEARRGNALLLADRVEHTDEPARSLVLRRAYPQADSQLRIPRRAGQAYRSGLGHLGAPRPHRDQQGRLALPRQLEPRGAVGLPAKMRLDGHAHYDVPRQGRYLADREVGRRPGALTIGLRAGLEADVRPGKAEV